MVKKILIAVGIVFVLAVIVLGWDKAESYVIGTQKIIKEEVDDRSPMRLEKARIEALIDMHERKLMDFEDRVADMEAQRAATTRRVEASRTELQAEEDLLHRIKELLDQKQDQYSIGNHTYAFAEVNADALERVAEVRGMRESVDFNESLIADLDAGIKQGRANLHQGEKRLTELRQALARLDQQNVNADLRLQVAELTNAVAGAPLSADSELEQAMRNFERRIDAKDRRATTRLAAGRRQFRIDYSADVVTREASAAIEQLLGESSGAPPAIQPAPQARPSAAESLEAAPQEGDSQP